MTSQARIYLDYAATTPLHPQVLEVMAAAYQDLPGNPSSLHQSGRAAAEAIGLARATIAQLLGASSPAEIIFTGSGSEADNLAIIGAARAAGRKGSHILTSAIEHHAVLHACEFLEGSGFRVDRLPVDRDGLVRPADLERAIQPDTILITIMHANNEIGTIQPIPELAALARERGILFHTDAVQSAGQIPLNVKDLQVDLLTLSPHKFYGPKGVGVLFVREGVELLPLIHGGNQENRLRAGTENLPGILGASKALELALADQAREAERLRGLRDDLLARLKDRIPDLRLNGHPSQRLPNNLNVCFKDYEAEGLLLRLNLLGIEASMGSACTSASIEPSHVIRALGVEPAWERGALRLSLGKYTSQQDINQTAQSIAEIILN